MFVLLPDARLWATKNFRWQELNEYETYRDKDGQDLRRKVQIPLTVDGEFLGNSNWVSLASTWRRVLGIQSDGSLWHVFTRDRTNDSSMPKLERIGTGSDWVSVAAGYNHFLVLKNDGSLWGWGGNYSGQLGPGPEQFTNELVRVTRDSDWVSAFVSRSASIGIKRDGSVWKWGFLQTSPNGDEKKWANEHPDPVRWNWEGTNWISIVDNYGSDLAVRSDGSLWTAGYLRANLLGKSLGTRFPFERRFAAKPLQVAPAAAIADISTGGSFLIALTGSGALLENFQYSPPPFWARATWKVSRHSDWLAIDGSYGSGEIRALASDGTLSRWRPSYHNRDISEDFLNSSRRPLASINILDSVK